MGSLVVRPTLIDYELNPAPFGRELDCIRQQVDNDLLELHGISDVPVIGWGCKDAIEVDPFA